VLETGILGNCHAKMCNKCIQEHTDIPHEEGLVDIRPKYDCIGHFSLANEP